MTNRCSEPASYAVQNPGYASWVPGPPVRLWDIATGEMLVEFRSDVDIPVVAFSPDGSELFYPDGANIARFPLDATQLVEQAGALLTRGFSPDECARYRGADLCP